MPKLLHARAPRDGEEKHQIRKLAGARHAPADWIQRAKIVGRRSHGIAVSNPAEPRSSPAWPMLKAVSPSPMSGQVRTISVCEAIPART